MPFTIVLLNDTTELGSIPRGESLREATAYALSRFAVERVRHQATEVQVRNEFGDILFRHKPE
ncbi:MAG: hypothetical protein WC804_06495 [Sphingomonas sp.]|jgi:hypothetical protein|uniref:hypothetical protein n=1 Tax=Sphingomonas sp. TaxID=28214 RepID=UPI001ACB91DE|nr:hypothetical protein [Sphingomonas sp.]MBN8815902.1 hypothetical protein [Sphingomonas sp.]